MHTVGHKLPGTSPWHHSVTMIWMFIGACLLTGAYGPTDQVFLSVFCFSLFFYAVGERLGECSPGSLLASWCSLGVRRCLPGCCVALFAPLQAMCCRPTLAQAWVASTRLPPAQRQSGRRVTPSCGSGAARWWC